MFFWSFVNQGNNFRSITASIGWEQKIPKVEKPTTSGEITLSTIFFFKALFCVNINVHLLIGQFNEVTKCINQNDAIDVGKAIKPAIMYTQSYTTSKTCGHELYYSFI